MAIKTLIWTFLCVTVPFAKPVDCLEDVQRSECSRTGVNINVTGPGFIYSPGFENGTYPSSAKCYWSLKAPAQKYVELSFVVLDLEEHNSCGLDYVILSSRQDDVRICGHEIPPRFVALGNQNVEVAFSSNKEVNRKGFLLRYTIIDDICPPSLHTCGNLRCISKELICNNVDDCGDGTDESTCEQRTQYPTVCGRPQLWPEEGNGDRVVGGREALPGSWPWQVSIQHGDVFPSGHFCGGALINNLWILTAAHCLRDLYRNPRVVLGRHSLYQKQEGDVVRYVKEIHLHPDYDSDGLHDIALAKLNSEVYYSQKISPVCLPDVKDTLVYGSYVHVTGWGETKSAGYSRVLKQAMLPVADHSQCVNAHSSFRVVGPDCFCTGYADQVHSPCIGDSGGPVVSSQNRTWILSGIVSWGSESCSYQVGPSVNTEVAAYIKWVTKKIN